MRYGYGRFPILRYVSVMLALGLGVVVFLPGGGGGGAPSDGSDRRSGGLSYLAASPSLVEELDNAVAPFTLSGEAIANEAARPDPTALTQAVTPPPPTAAETAVAASGVRVGDKALNMRVGPSKSTARVATLQPGQPVTISERNRNWVLVTTVNGESGWVYSTYLTGLPPENGAAAGEAVVADNAMPAREAEQPQQTVAAREQIRQDDNDEPSRDDRRYAHIRGDVVLRSGPSRRAERLFVIPAGERVAIAEVEGRWARVVLESGASGWVRIR